jgi:Holliday junction resolvasome RuvABC ATP-dependent DNA helicase subunit
MVVFFRSLKIESPSEWDNFPGEVGHDLPQSSERTKGERKRQTAGQGCLSGSRFGVRAEKTKIMEVDRMSKLRSVFSKPLERLLWHCHRLYENLYATTDATEFAARPDQTVTITADLDDDLLWAPRKQYESPLEMPIDGLDLSVRSYNCLKRANIVTVGDIARHSQKWLLLNVRNLGRKSIDEIVGRLAAIEVYMAELTEEEAAEEARIHPSALEQLNSMVGLVSVKERMKDISAHCFIRKLKSEVCGTEKSIVPNMLFLGNAGTGKTTAAKLMAQAFREIGLIKRGHLVRVTRADLVAEYTGQSAKKTTDIFESALDGVLFVDEAYSLYHKTESEHAGDTFTQEVIDTLTALMSEHAGRCCVIFAGYSDEMNYMLEHANPGLRERFPFKMQFDDYSAAELVEIFLLKAASQKLVISDECRPILAGTLNRMCSNKGRLFANGRVSENFLQEVILHQERRLFDAQQSGASLSEIELLTLSTKDFQAASESMLSAMPIVAAKSPIGFATA